MRNVLLILVITLLTYLRAGDPEVAQALSIDDDHLAFYSHLYKTPEAFRCVPWEKCPYRFAFASIQNSVPALLFKYAGIPPEFFSVLFVWLQNVLLIFALLRFCKILFSNRDHALVAALITYLAQPWSWNLAYYPSFLYTNYPGQLAMPFVLFAGAALIEKKSMQLFFSLLLTGLIHPSFGIYVFCIAALYTLVTLKESARLKQWGLLAAAQALALLPTFLTAGGGGGTPLSYEEKLAAVLHNPHYIPWQNEIFWTWSLPTLGGVIFLALWALKRQPKFVWFVKCLLTLLFCFGLGHFVAAKIGFIPLIQLVPLRASALVSTFLFPLALSGLLKCFDSDSRLERFAAAQIVLMHASFSSGLLWVPILVLFLPKKSAGVRFGVAALLLWNLSLLGANRLTYTPGLEMIGHVSVTLSRLGISQFTRAEFLVGVFTALLFAFWPRGEKRVVSLGVALLAVAFFVGPKAQKLEAGRDLFLAQKWARENTPPGTTFLVEKPPWSAYSLRPAVRANNNPFGYFVYTGTKEIKAKADFLQSLYAEQKVTRYGELPQEALLRLAAKEEAGYIVRRVAEPLQLPESYRNDSLVVYRVNDSAH